MTEHFKRYLRLPQEALRTGQRERTVHRRIKEDGYPYIRSGNVLLFDPELSDEWFAARVHRGRAAELASAA